MSKAVWLLSGAFGAAAMISVVVPGMAADLDPAAKTIQGIDEVGIQDCEGNPDDLGTRFYQSVANACVGKVSCQVRVTDVESEADLRSFGCTSVIVIAICGPGDLQEHTSDGLSEPLLVSCGT